ncbi:MAG: hypothetical protein WCI38_08340, partial [Chthoniobacterales bacterium]
MKTLHPLIILCLLGTALSLPCQRVRADDVTLKIGDPSGWISPQLIGYNMAVNPPESNVASFLRHSGVGA